MIYFDLKNYNSALSRNILWVFIAIFNKKGLSYRAYSGYHTKDIMWLSCEEHTVAIIPGIYSYHTGYKVVIIRAI